MTQYLTEAAVTAMLGALRTAASGSRLVFTYVRKDFIDGLDMYGSASLYKRFRQRQQVWKFGLNPDDVAEFVARYGWELVEQAGPDYYVKNYIEPAGRRPHRLAAGVGGVLRQALDAAQCQPDESRRWVGVDPSPSRPLVGRAEIGRLQNQIGNHSLVLEVRFVLDGPPTLALVVAHVGEILWGAGEFDVIRHDDAARMQ